MLEMLNTFLTNEKKISLENFSIDISDWLTSAYFHQDNLSAERALDERNNRVGSALTCLAYIVCASSVCEKKALFAFCQLTKARNVETEKIKMVNILDLFWISWYLMCFI